MTDEQRAFVDELVTRLVKKGQPLTHIYAEHEAEMPMSLRSLYNYIDAGELSMHALFALLKMDLIPPDEVHLMPDLFKKNR